MGFTIASICSCFAIYSNGSIKNWRGFPSEVLRFVYDFSWVFWGLHFVKASKVKFYSVQCGDINGAFQNDFRWIQASGIYEICLDKDASKP